MTSTLPMPGRNHPIDRVVELRAPDRIRTLRLVATDLPIFDEHFPGRPILPGAMVIDGVIASAMLLVDGTRGPAADLPVIRVAALRLPCPPGEILETEVSRVAGSTADAFAFRVVAQFSGELIADGRLQWPDGVRR